VPSTCYTKGLNLHTFTVNPWSGRLSSQMFSHIHRAEAGFFKRKAQCSSPQAGLLRQSPLVVYDSNSDRPASQGGCKMLA
jgi:hypothetical protein